MRKATSSFPTPRLTARLSSPSVSRGRISISVSPLRRSCRADALAHGQPRARGTAFDGDDCIMALNAGVLEKLRRLCLSLPEAREVASFGHPCWKVAKKTFACFERYNGEQVVTFKTDPLEQDRLVASGDGYRIAPYVGRYGWVCQGVKSIR